MASPGGYIDNTAAFQDFNLDDNTNKIKNPFVTIFHLFFKLCALVGNDFELVFVIVCTCLSILTYDSVTALYSVLSQV